MSNDQDAISRPAGTSEISCSAEFEHVVNDLDSLLRKLEISTPEPGDSRSSRLHLLELRSAVLELDLFNRKLEDLCEDLQQTRYGLDQMSDTASAELREDAAAPGGDAGLSARHHKLLIDESFRVQQAISNVRAEVISTQRRLLSTLRQTSVAVFNMAAASASFQATKFPAAAPPREASDMQEPERITPPPASDFGAIVSNFIS